MTFAVQAAPGPQGGTVITGVSKAAITWKDTPNDSLVRTLIVPLHPVNCIHQAIDANHPTRGIALPPFFNLPAGVFIRNWSILAHNGDGTVDVEVFA